jgi:hypothetical protein
MLDVDFEPPDCGTNWTTVSTNLTSIKIKTLSAGTSYNYAVEAICNSGPSGYTASQNFTTTGTGYCTTGGQDATLEYLTFVWIGAVQNVSVSNNGYGDYTNLSTDLAQGSTMYGYLSATLPYRLSEYYRIWIDYNHDNDFTDAGELAVNISSYFLGWIAINFTVPENAQPGATRMRITMEELTSVEQGYFSLPATYAKSREQLAGVEMTQRLNALAGEHGIGRIDHLEDRLVGIKSREVYESPAAMTLLRAHEALEHMTLSKQQLRLKASVAHEYAELIYNGLWFTAHHQDLAHYVQSTQRHVTGTVRIRLHKGQATVVGTKSPRSLYAAALATYEKGDQYDHSSAEGFIKIWGLPVRVQAEAQLLSQGDDTLHIASPDDA